jgi:hypothetical protein
MDYSIYEDRPQTDAWIKGVFILPPVLLLIIAAFFSPINLREALYLAYETVAMAVFMGMLFLLVIPKKYCVYTTKIRIEFRGPFAFNIPFDTITSLRDVQWSTVGINLPTNMSRSSLLEIARKRRMAVTISPSDRKAFIANFEKAYRDWDQSRSEA